MQHFFTLSQLNFLWHTSAFCCRFDLQKLSSLFEFRVRKTRFLLQAQTNDVVSTMWFLWCGFKRMMWFLRGIEAAHVAENHEEEWVCLGSFGEGLQPDSSSSSDNRSTELYHILLWSIAKIVSKTILLSMGITKGCAII